MEASPASQLSCSRPSLSLVIDDDGGRAAVLPKSPDITYPAFDAKDDSDAAFELLCRMFDERLLVSDADAGSPDSEPESPYSRCLPSLFGECPPVLSGDLNDLPAYVDVPNDQTASAPTGYLDDYQLGQDALGADPRPMIPGTNFYYHGALNHPESRQYQRFEEADVRVPRSEHPALLGTLQGHSAVPTSSPSPVYPRSSPLTALPLSPSPYLRLPTPSSSMLLGTSRISLWTPRFLATRSR
ncbi:hypothetical protein RhiLY_06534 [Ceratobasidium sp. AG-Ba]|nr:hypothetical protein RhiLY_06534 [Ceratobasidium sp. AG-Ba]